MKLSSWGTYIITILFFILCSVIGFKTFANLPGDELQENNAFSFQSFTQKLNEELNEIVAYKENFINLNGFIKKSLGSYESNEVVRLNNGFLTTPMKKENTDLYAERVVELNDYLQEKGIPLLYFMCPSKIDPLNNQLPIGYQDFSNENMDNFLNILSKEKVDFIDMREYFHKQNISFTDCFFNTDHHWNIKTGFMSYQLLSEYMSNHYNVHINPEYLDLDNYSSDVYEDIFLGSQGKRTGVYFGGVDDITIYTPDYSSDFEVAIQTKAYKTVRRSGSFEEAILAKYRVEKTDYFNQNPYAVYWGGDYPVVRATNNLAENNLKTIIIKDSFGLVPSAYLCNNFKDTILIDLRYLRDITLVEYINQENPDYIIMIFNNSTFTDEMYSFGLS